MSSNPYSTESQSYPSVPTMQQPATVMQPLIENSGWIRFLGWALIITGVLYCITIVGILFAWVPIWMGILLKRAGENLKSAQSFNDPNLLYQASKDLSVHFVIMAILFIISLALTALYMIVAILFIIMGAVAAAGGNM